MKIRMERNFDSGRRNNNEKICLFSEILKNNPIFLITDTTPPTRKYN